MHVSLKQGAARGFAGNEIKRWETIVIKTDNQQLECMKIAEKRRAGDKEFAIEQTKKAERLSSLLTITRSGEK